MKIITVAIIILTMISCSEKNKIVILLNQDQIIPSGEWISYSDSLSGLSVRKNHMAFYKNNKFNGEDVAVYSIIDSVEIEDNNKKILGSYLIAKGLDDTLNYKITNRSLQSISLELKNGKTEMFTLKKK